MKRTVKTMSVLLAFLVLAVGIFTGCGTGKNSDAAEAPSSMAVSTGEHAAAGTGGGAELAEATLNFYYPSTPQRDQKAVFDELNKMTKSKFNCTLDYKPTDWAQWPTKYPILLSSGEKVDLIFTSGSNGFFQEVQKNSFLPLNELLEKYGKDISASMQDGYLDATKINGNIYAIPANKDMGCGWGAYFNKEMADKIGVDTSNIKYLGDLEPLLAKAKDGLPGVTPFFIGADSDPSLLYASTKECEDIGFRNHTKIIAMDDYIAYSYDTGKVAPFYDIPEYINQCKLMRSWFQKGYINKDSITTQGTAQDAIKNKKAFMILGSVMPGQKESYEQTYGMKLYGAELMPGIKETSSLTGALTALPSHCSNPERAMMVLNLAFGDKEFINTFAFGVKDRHYVMKSDNVISLPQGAGSAEEIGYNPIVYWEAGDNFKLYTWDNENPDRWNQIKDFNTKLIKSQLLGFSLNIENIKTEVAAHKNVLSEFNKLLTVGAADTDEVIARMKKKDKAAGIDKICSEIETQVQAWKASQK